jgi:hypothetical protein
MFSSFTETNVGPCTTQGGAYVGYIKKKIVCDKNLNAGEFCLKVLPKENQIFVIAS